jgi:plasmid stabilization system protein ParE
MNAPVIYLPEARDDVDATYTAYEQRAAGLGQRFLDQLQTRVDGISANPQLYAVLRDGVRAAPLRRFPYVVYYRFEAGTVYILAVLHGGRDPQTWMRRA